MLDSRKFLELPDSVFVETEPHVALERANRSGDGFQTSTAEIQTIATGNELRISITVPRGPIARVALRWLGNFSEDAIFLGDHWERGYGDLQWRTLQPDRILPWYFAAHDRANQSTIAVGVKTGGSSIASWLIDSSGVTLWLDLRNGGSSSIPGDRAIPAATVVTDASFGRQSHGQSPMDVLTRLCKKMCDAPRLPSTPVAGNNNWYYAYGENFDQHQVRRDAELLSELAGNHAVRPYCVIDAGWTDGGGAPGGPWTHGKAKEFPDMPGLASDFKKMGVRPGIWIRPTALTIVDDPKRLRPGPHLAPEKPLDLTLPENLQLIHDDVARIRSWGYELIKHDFSTYDIFARWGFQMDSDLTEPGWHFADRSLTNAEIVLNLYRTLRQAAGDAILIGCNTIGHLGAGLFELQRTGDDTSGKVWERTRKMGINTLAFRQPQNRTFFINDADCVAQTEKTPWEKTRQFLDVVARSGTALFVSVDPTKISPDVKREMSSAMKIALDGGAKSCEPVDWLTSTCPKKWRIDGKDVEYDWDEATGAWPLKN